jgi:hypothetical protein
MTGRQAPFSGADAKACADPINVRQIHSTASARRKRAGAVNVICLSIYIVFLCNNFCEAATKLWTVEIRVSAPFAAPAAIFSGAQIPPADAPLYLVVTRAH